MPTALPSRRHDDRRLTFSQTVVLLVHIARIRILDMRLSALYGGRSGGGRNRTGRLYCTSSGAGSRSMSRSGPCCRGSRSRRMSNRYGQRCRCLSYRSGAPQMPISSISNLNTRDD